MRHRFSVCGQMALQAPDGHGPLLQLRTRAIQDRAQIAQGIHHRLQSRLVGHLFQLALLMNEFPENFVRTVAGLCQRLVDRTSVLVKLAADASEQFHIRLRADLLNHTPLPQRAFQFIHQPLLVGVMAMNLQTGIAEADGIEPALHYLQRGHFLRHKQHPFALPQGLRHEVGDGLRFASTGRPLDDHVAAVLYV